MQPPPPPRSLRDGTYARAKSTHTSFDFPAYSRPDSLAPAPIHVGATSILDF